jgi:molybdopterin synthase sulfur carrier subunit
MAFIRSSVGMLAYVDRRGLVEVPGATLGAVLDAFTSLHPETKSMIFDYRGDIQEFMNIYVDGEDAKYGRGLETPTAPDSTVMLVPAGGGG